MSKNVKKKRNLQFFLYAATRIRTVIVSRFYGLGRGAIVFRMILTNEGGRCVCDTRRAEELWLSQRIEAMRLKSGYRGI